MGEFKDDKGETVFVDDDGRMWTSDNVSDVIKSLKKLKEFKSTLDYYAERLL